MTALDAPTETATLVTQTRVLSGKDADFARWQQRMSDAVAAAPGFLDQQVIPPSPPDQVDWVIVERFRSAEDARAWLASPERQRLLAEVQPLLAGHDDIHLFNEGTTGAPDTTMSAVISTRVAPGHEREYRAWQRRIAVAEAAFPGFRGTKLEPPIPGVQDDWVSIVRFDSDAHLQAWLRSSERARLIEEVAAFAPDSRIRTVRGGFDTWFTFGAGPSPGTPAAWKQNMIVLLVLYPVVFLFGRWVQTPLLVDRGVPFWLALFAGNAVSAALLGWLFVPWASRVFKWWLTPSATAPRWTAWAGTAAVLALYGVALALFSRFP